MRYLYISLMFLFLSSISVSQNTVQNLKKYWYYKKRLHRKFMVVSAGNESGTNIPAHRRGYVPANWKSVYTGPCRNEDEQIVTTTSIPVLDWGDNNGELQHYIAVLATEYRLLKDYGQNYEQTFNELIWAMRALERIDFNTESNYKDSNGNSGTNSNNGFMMRDDVPSNFLSLHNDSNHDFDGRYAWSSYAAHGTGWCNDRPPAEPHEMSQDIVWNYLPALALVNKLVDDNRTVCSAGTMRDWAKQRTYLMVKRLQCDICWFTKWELNNPVTEEPVEEGSTTSAMGGGLQKPEIKLLPEHILHCIKEKYRYYFPLIWIIHFTE